MVGVKLKLDSEHHCPTEGGVISFFRGEVLSGVLNCRAWSADPDPSDRYNLEWQVAFDFECSKGRFRYSGFLPNLTPAALDPEKVVFHGPERDFQADFGPGEALDDGRDYRYIVRSDGRAVFVKNKYKVNKTNGTSAFLMFPTPVPRQKMMCTICLEHLFKV